MTTLRCRRSLLFGSLGVRVLSFLVQGLLDRLVYLSTRLAIILALDGVKLILHWLRLDVSTAVPEILALARLAVIPVSSAVVVVASLVTARKDPTADAHAGSLEASGTRTREHQHH